jgi:GTP-binding protein HflX
MRATVVVPVLKQGRAGRSAGDAAPVVTRTPESRLE